MKTLDGTLISRQVQEAGCMNLLAICLLSTQTEMHMNGPEHAVWHVFLLLQEVYYGHDDFMNSCHQQPSLISPHVSRYLNPTSDQT